MISMTGYWEEDDRSRGCVPVWIDTVDDATCSLFDEAVDSDSRTTPMVLFWFAFVFVSVVVVFVVVVVERTSNVTR